MEYVDNPFKSPSILSLCTGMRGLERGLQRAIGPIRVAAYVEIEAFIVFNLVRQMEQGVVDKAPVWTNVKTFPAQQFYRKIHGLIGGYPCQPFSRAGLQTGEYHPAHLWPYIKPMARTIRPVWCFFENVANHLNIGYQQVKADLEELGYTVKEGIYSAIEAGASHRRERLFILAVDHSLSEGLERYSWNVNGATGQIGAKQARSASPASFPMEQADDGLISNVAGSNGSGKEREGLQERNNVQKSGKSSGVMANSDSSGSGENTQPGELRTDSVKQPSCDSGITYTRKNNEGGFNRWPAGPGPFQYEWEESRTIKPRMGSTVNGYNFHTDLLRMYGNGVVEQTAEIAFIDLFNKHFYDHLETNKKVPLIR